MSLRNGPSKNGPPTKCPSDEMSLRNGPWCNGPPTKCPLLSKCPFNEIWALLSDNVNYEVLFIKSIKFYFLLKFQIGTVALCELTIWYG